MHALTASGAVVGFLAVAAAAEEQPERALLFMLLALAIDSVDGTLARAVGVVEATPSIDGRRLDDIVDYENFVLVPVLFMSFSGLFPNGALGVAVAATPLIASAFGFAHRHAKTPDHFFLGFPSYWNLVALYCWFLAIPPLACAAITVVLAVGVFVPFRFLYPSRAPRLRRTTWILGGLWFALLGAALLFPGAAWAPHATHLSLFFPIYYLVLSAWLGGFGRGDA